MSPTKFNQICHKVIVLSDLLIDGLDELSQEVDTEEYKQDILKNKQLAEKLLETVFNIKDISSSTYLQDLSQKVDTVIRKNYKPIEQ